MDQHFLCGDVGINNKEHVYSIPLLVPSICLFIGALGRGECQGYIAPSICHPHYPMLYVIEAWWSSSTTHEVNSRVAPPPPPGSKWPPLASRVRPGCVCACRLPPTARVVSGARLSFLPGPLSYILQHCNGQNSEWVEEASIRKSNVSTLC